MTELAYHYSDVARLPFILSSGHIRVSRHIRAKIDPEVPSGVCWFTLDRRGDPSAAAFHNGLALPRIRLCVPTNATLDWREACRAAGWSEADIELAARRGRECGGRADRWRAVPGLVSLAKVVDVHVLRPGGVWRPMGEPVFRVQGDIAAIAVDNLLFGIQRRVVPGLGTMAYAVRHEFDRDQGDAAVLRNWLTEAAA
jgi:hypothetical protein